MSTTVTTSSSPGVMLQARSPRAITPRAATPLPVRRLRRLRLAAVALLIAFGALVIAALAVSTDASSKASQSLRQYERLSDARVQALRVQQAANTWAITPTDAVRTDLTGQLTSLAGLLADASAAPADHDRVVRLSGALVQYSMTLQDALNARGEASAALLAKADAQLAERLLNPLAEVAKAAADRMPGELTAGWLPGVSIAFVLVAGGLTTVLVLLARASHRYVNLGVALALVSALAALLVLAATGSTAGGAAENFSSQTRATLDAVGTARQQLAQARADELLAVGLRSPDGAQQQRWATNLAAARTAIRELPSASPAVAALDRYKATHQDLAAAGNRGQWDVAVGLATNEADDRANAAHSALSALEAKLRSPVDGLVGGVADQVWASIAGVIALTVAGAALAAWGVGRRLAEYR